MDRTRGLIMVFMALDHALFFWSSGRVNNEGLPLLVNGVLTFNPIGNYNVLALIEMFLSSLCAPGFLFIAGYVLSLSIKKREAQGITNSNITLHLWRRAIILIALQILIASPAFNLPLFLQAKSLSIVTWGTVFSLSILSTFGIGFFLLSLGRRLSPWILLLFSGLLYSLSLLSIPSITRNFPFQHLLGQAWQTVFILPVPFSTGLLVNNNFPVIPWFLPLSIGWLYGQTYARDLGIAHEAKRFAVSGSLSVALFFVLRFAGIGDYLHPTATISGFFGLSKYPPSPDYFLLYLGLIFLILWAFSKLPQTSKFGSILENFGQAPLFFYNVHLWLYAAIPALFAGFNTHSLAFGVLIWLTGLLVLYPLCQKYLAWKKSNSVRRASRKVQTTV
jgi:uncharacterized membrane protein